MKQEIPSIAVPIISRRAEDILSDAEKISVSCADIAEWRVDYFEYWRDTEKITALLPKVRQRLCGKKLLFTCRTAEEGGEARLTTAEYRAILFAAAGQTDYLDTQLNRSETFLSELLRTAHDSETAVVLSYHHFRETPSEKDLLAIYEKMHRAGGDILKIAVMSHTDADVDRLIRVARTASQLYRKRLIAIGMGERGQCTRIAGETIGSCLTFGTLGGESAPGQLDVYRLHEMCASVHEHIAEFCAARDAAALGQMIMRYCTK